MTYDKQILQILSTAGIQGMSVQALAKHVYNMNATFFSQPDLGEIRTYVQQYLLRNSKSDSSLIERTERRGFYRLNTSRNADARQLVLEFLPKEEKETELSDDNPVSYQDYSLNLFSD